MADRPARPSPPPGVRSHGRLVGALTRMTRDLDLAEDLAQDALVSALEQWPSRGIPDNPAPG